MAQEQSKPLRHATYWRDVSPNRFIERTLHLMAVSLGVSGAILALPGIASLMQLSVANSMPGGAILYLFAWVCLTVPALVFWGFGQILGRLRRIEDSLEAARKQECSKAAKADEEESPDLRLSSS